MEINNALAADLSFRLVNRDTSLLRELRIDDLLDDPVYLSAVDRGYLSLGADREPLGCPGPGPALNGGDKPLGIESKISSILIVDGSLASGKTMTCDLPLRISSKSN